ncbi:MAG: transposase [Rubrobacter sp.]|nr:transposase [Rubrobacter sp.]
MDNKGLPTNISDAEWTYLRSHLPDLQGTFGLRGDSLRDVLDAIFYVLKSGCPWRLLPGDFPPWQTVYIVTLQSDVGSQRTSEREEPRNREHGQRASGTPERFVSP